MIRFGLIGANRNYISLFKEIQDLEIFKLCLIFEPDPDRELLEFAEKNGIPVTDNLKDIFKHDLRLLVDTTGKKDLIYKIIEIKPEYVSVIDLSIFYLFLDSIRQKLHMEKRLTLAQRYETIGTLVSGISHEFNNILMIIMGHAQLASINAPPEIAPHIEGIINSCKRASRLIEQLASFSRQYGVEKRIVNIVPLIKETVKFIKSALPENIDIKLEIEPNIPEIVADLTQIRQMLLNLASNSQEAMPSGGQIYIKLSTRYLDEDFCKRYPFVTPGNYLWILFKDTGIGIPKEYLPRIFEPFFTTKELGRGLGLSSVYGIVKQHNGYILVESEYGKGTEFNIYFPAAGQKKKEDKGDSTGGKILIAEDEKELLEVTSKFLDKLGYKVLKANTGKEAIKYIEEEGEDIEVVITDHILPDMFGYVIVHKAKFKNPKVKSILLTGYNKEDAILDKDMFDVIAHKPISMTELSKKLVLLLNK